METSLQRWLAIALLSLGCRSATTADSDEHAAAQRELARGIDLVQHGDFETGIQVLRGVLDAVPEDRELVVPARSWIASALTQSGDPEAALRECELALELAPEDPWLYYASGVAWHKMGELERARDSFTRAIENDPRHLKSLQWRAQVLRDLDDDRAAIDDLTRTLECIETADEATLRSWGGDRRMLLLKTLSLRIQAYDDLGLHDEAARDRARYEQVFAGEAPASTTSEAEPPAAPE